MERAEICDLLFTHGADVTIQNHFGFDSFHYFSQRHEISPALFQTYHMHQDKLTPAMQDLLKNMRLRMYMGATNV